MTSTRRNADGANSQAPPPNITSARMRETPAIIATSGNELEPDDAELTDLLASLSNESKTLVKILKTVITKQFRTEMEMLSEEISKKDAVI